MTTLKEIYLSYNPFFIALLVTLVSAFFCFFKKLLWILAYAENDELPQRRNRIV